MPEADVLSEAACRDLLGAGVFGRYAVTTDAGPVIVPVNYSLSGEAVVVATATGTLLARHAPGHPVAFEVDHVDHTRYRGWSVLVTGVAELVEDPEAVARIRRTWEPRPWASGTRDLLLRLPWTRISGRRLGTDWRAEELTPVRRRTGW